MNVCLAHMAAFLVSTLTRLSAGIRAAECARLGTIAPAQALPRHNTHVRPAGECVRWRKLRKLLCTAYTKSIYVTVLRFFQVR